MWLQCVCGIQKNALFIQNFATRCWSACKTMNSHCHTRGWIHHMLNHRSETVTTPPPPSNGQVSKCKCWLQLQDNRPFHFCLGKSTLPYDDMTFPLCFHSRSNYTNKAQWSIVIHFYSFAQHQRNHLYHTKFKWRNPWNGWENHQTTSSFC